MVIVFYLQIQKLEQPSTAILEYHLHFNDLNGHPLVFHSHAQKVEPLQSTMTELKESTALSHMVSNTLRFTPDDTDFIHYRLKRYDHIR